MMKTVPPKKGRVVRQKLVRPHVQALFATWFFVKAGDDYLLLPEAEQNDIVADFFRCLMMFVDSLGVSIEGDGPLNLDEKELRPEWEAWLKAMPMPKGTTRCYLGV